MAKFYMELEVGPFHFFPLFIKASSKEWFSDRTLLVGPREILSETITPDFF